MKSLTKNECEFIHACIDCNRNYINHSFMRDVPKASEQEIMAPLITFLGDYYGLSPEIVYDSNMNYIKDRVFAWSLEILPKVLAEEVWKYTFKECFKLSEKEAYAKLWSIISWFKKEEFDLDNAYEYLSTTKIEKV